MAGAAYQLNHSLTDDESFEFSVESKITDDSDFPWDDYTHDYSLMRENGLLFSLTQSDGITITEALNIISFAKDPTYRLPVGTYRHGYRITHTARGTVFQVFDGSVTVTEGNF